MTAEQENKRLRELLRDCRMIVREVGYPKLAASIDTALSQQSEPAPAQDEQSPEQMLSREQIENIARKVHGDCIRLPGATYQHAAEAAVMYTLERIARPTQTEQHPIYQIRPRENVRDWLDTNADGYRAAKAMASMEVRMLYAAPIAHTAPQPEEVKAAIRNLRCIGKTVLSSEARASMRADLESAAQLLIKLSTPQPEQDDSLNMEPEGANAYLVVDPDDNYHICYVVRSKDQALQHATGGLLAFGPITQGGNS